MLVNDDYLILPSTAQVNHHLLLLLSYHKSFPLSPVYSVYLGRRLICHLYKLFGMYVHSPRLCLLTHNPHIKKHVLFF